MRAACERAYTQTMDGSASLLGHRRQWQRLFWPKRGALHVAITVKFTVVFGREAQVNLELDAMASLVFGREAQVNLELDAMASL
jgi:hypothetical protein